MTQEDIIKELEGIIVDIERQYGEAQRARQKELNLIKKEGLVKIQSSIRSTYFKVKELLTKIKQQ